MFAWAKSLANTLAERNNYRLQWKPQVFFDDPSSELSIDFSYILSHYMLKNPSPYFINIGANDGVANDPLYPFIRKFNLEGLVIEPIADVFEMLQENYRDLKGVRCVRAAIAEVDGQRTMYTAKPEAGGFAKVHQFSSFRKEVISSQTYWEKNIDRMIVEETVECISFNTLLSTYASRSVDIIHIDAEGYDAKIIKMIDFTKTSPSIIEYEHSNLSKDEINDCAAMLSGQGYKLVMGNSNTIAYRAANL